MASEPGKLVGGWCAAHAYQRGAKAPRRSHHKTSAWPLPGGATITVDTLFSRVDESLLAADDVLYRVDERGEMHVEVLADSPCASATAGASRRPTSGSRC